MYKTDSHYKADRIRSQLSWVGLIHDKTWKTRKGFHGGRVVKLDKASSGKGTAGSVVQPLFIRAVVKIPFIREPLFHSKGLPTQRISEPDNR